MARIALVQMDVLWENAAGNAAKVKDMLASQDRKLDLIILPELWSCGFTMNHDAHETFDIGFQAMKEISDHYNCPVLGGLPHAIEGGQQNRCYLVDGDESRHYAKVKVFKFAGEHHKYQAGSEVKRWEVAGFKLTPLICYDLRFPELVRPMMPDTQMVSYIASWPKPRVHHWRQLLAARSIENLCYVIGVNRVGVDGAGLEYNGQSMVLAPGGDVVLDAGDAEGVFECDVDPQMVKDIRHRFRFLDDM